MSAAIRLFLLIALHLGSPAACCSQSDDSREYDISIAVSYLNLLHVGRCSCANEFLLLLFFFKKKGSSNAILPSGCNNPANQSLNDGRAGSLEEWNSWHSWLQLCHEFAQAKDGLSQKLTLACSLCLTAIVIIFTVTRAFGLEWQDKLDVIWEVYFQIVAAEIGLILVAMTAFRALFVSRAARNQHSPHGDPSSWTKSLSVLRKLLNPRRWMLRYSKDMTEGHTHRAVENGFGERLPSIPGATITGINTFINQQGTVASSEIEFSTYPASLVENQDISPSLTHPSIPRSCERKSLHDASNSERFRFAGP